MPWTYCQTDGAFTDPDEARAGEGYSGHGPGLNNPAMEADAGVGPIPAGPWRMRLAVDHPRLGPCAIPLTPDGFDPHGRSEFFIHGDNAQLNHGASHGCIVTGHAVRVALAGSLDRTLHVIR